MHAAAELAGVEWGHTAQSNCGSWFLFFFTLRQKKKSFIKMKIFQVKKKFVRVKKCKDWYLSPKKQSIDIGNSFIRDKDPGLLWKVPLQKGFSVSGLYQCWGFLAKKVIPDLKWTPSGCHRHTCRPYQDAKWEWTWTSSSNHCYNRSGHRPEQKQLHQRVG